MFVELKKQKTKKKKKKRVSEIFGARARVQKTLFVD
jgi:hypothetical protein